MFHARLPALGYAPWTHMCMKKIQLRAHARSWWVRAWPRTSDTRLRNVFPLYSLLHVVKRPWRMVGWCNMKSTVSRHDMQTVWRIQKRPVDCNIDHVPMQSSRLHLHCSAIILDLRIAVQGELAQKQKTFQQTCISMNEMITCCFSKKSTQSFNTCSLSVAMWEQWKCQFLQHHQTSEIPHMQITTFNTSSASNACHLFKFIIANTLTPKK